MAGVKRRGVQAFVTFAVMVMAAIMAFGTIGTSQAWAAGSIAANAIDYSKFQESGYYFELIEDTDNKVTTVSESDGAVQSTKAVSADHIASDGGFQDWYLLEHVPTYNPSWPSLYSYHEAGGYRSEPGKVFMSDANAASNGGKGASFTVRWSKAAKLHKVGESVNKYMWVDIECKTTFQQTAKNTGSAGSKAMFFFTKHFTHGFWMLNVVKIKQTYKFYETGSSTPIRFDDGVWVHQGSMNKGEGMSVSKAQAAFVSNDAPVLNKRFSGYVNAQNNWSTVPGSYVYEFTDTDDADEEDSSMFGYLGAPNVYKSDGTSADFTDNSAYSEGRNEWTFEEVKHTYYWRSAAILADVAGKTNLNVTHYAVGNTLWPQGTTIGSTSGSDAAPYLDKNVPDPDNFNNYGCCYLQQDFRPLTAALPPDPVKSVDKEEAEVDDILQYQVDQFISKAGVDSADDYTMESATFTDTLPDDVAYVDGSFTVIDTEGRDVTDRFGTLKVNGQTLKYEFEKDYLENELKYNGNALTFKFQVKVLDNAAGKTLENQATVRLNDYDLETNIVTTKIKTWEVGVEKLSAYDEVFDGNGAYKLSDARFEIRDEVDHLIATLTTDEDGKAGPVRIKNSGTYRIIETVAPDGHKLSQPNVQTIVLNNDNANVETTVTFTNEPVLADTGFEFIAVKSDGDYYIGTLLGENSEHLVGSAWHQGNAPDLSGCKVRVDFYAGAAAVGTPLASAVFQANEQGRIAFADSTPVDGTTWRYQYKGKNVIPIGYVVVTEIAAPEGYVLNDETHEAHIRQRGEEAYVTGARRWYVLDWAHVFGE